MKISMFPYVGGKATHIGKIIKFFPETFEHYYEPFIGAGGLFFHMKQNDLMYGDIKSWNISDLNFELIECYKHVRDDVTAFTKIFSEMQTDEDFFYSIRKKYNESEQSIEKSVMYFYLLNFCYRGMYRVNSKGYFNSPYCHSRESLSIKNITKKLKIISELLQDVNITNAGYDKIKPKSNSFIFMDPPYHETMDSYNGNVDIHTDEFHKILNSYCNSLDNSIYFCQTNSNTFYIRNLYSDYSLFDYETNKGMSLTEDKTNKEILIRNF